MSLSVPPGSLTAVVGTVGAGKSSLLSALLGDMEIITGQVQMKVSTDVTYTANDHNSDVADTATAITGTG